MDELPKCHTNTDAGEGPSIWGPYLRTPSFGQLFLSSRHVASLYVEHKRRNRSASVATVILSVHIGHLSSRGKAYEMFRCQYIFIIQ